MKKLLLLLLIAFFFSCESEKNYTYIVTYNDLTYAEGAGEKTRNEEIIAKNDTLAYIRAYSRFKITQRRNEYNNETGWPYPEETISFQLLNEKGEDISNIEFKTKKAEQSKSDEYALNLKSSYTESAKNRSENRKTTYQEVKINPCVMSEDFIKRDLRYPKTAKFSIFNCSSERNDDGSYTILRKVSAKNAFGVESEFVYKVRMGFTGGVDVDINNWKLIGIVSEEYNK